VVADSYLRATRLWKGELEEEETAVDVTLNLRVAPTNSYFRAPDQNKLLHKTESDGG